MLRGQQRALGVFHVLSCGTVLSGALVQQERMSWGWDRDRKGNSPKSSQCGGRPSVLSNGCGAKQPQEISEKCSEGL